LVAIETASMEQMKDGSMSRIWRLVHLVLRS
jgi:hypothetical protein